MKYLQKLNEWYKFPKDFNIWDPQPKTYIDNVFDNLMRIICDEKRISEKSFTELDNTKSYIESYFDNNQEILLECDRFSSDKKRSQYCAEELYYKYFQNDKILESINSDNLGKNYKS